MISVQTDIPISSVFKTLRALNKLPLKLKLQTDNPQIINRAICDFISGMTDNYAYEQYKEYLK